MASAEVSVPSAVAPQHSVAATSSTQLSSIATAVEADLRALCTESRRSHPPIVDAAERALAKLRTLSNPEVAPGTGVAKTPLQILQSQTVLRPFLLACASKLPKLTISALTSIQKLVSVTPLSAKFLASLMGTLRIQAENEDQTVQLKILQTLLITISPAAVECGELLQGSLLQALNICFRLFLQKKSSIIHHTAFAALRQLVTLLFDRVTWQSEKGLLWQQKPQVAQPTTVAADGSAVSDPTNPNPHSNLLPSPLDQLSYEGQNAYLLFQDLCILCSAGSNATDPAGASGGASGAVAPASASGGKPRWLTNLSAPIPTEVCIELMENILSSNHRLFQAQPLFFSYLIKSQVCSLLIKLLRSHFEFGMVLRLIRTILVLIKYFHGQLREEIEIFLSLFIRMMNFEFPLWHRVLVLEATLQMLHLNNDKFSFWLYANYDVAPSANASAAAGATPANPNQTKIFTSLIHALSRLVVQTATNLSEGMSPTASSVGGNLGVGSSGVSFNALITQSSTVPVVTVTTPSSPTASSASPSGVSSPMPFHFSLGKPDPLTLPTPVASLIWKLYSSKGNRGLDLLNLDQDSSSSSTASSTNPAGSALSIHPSANLYEESYVITLGTECMVTIVNGFAALAKTNEKWGGGVATAETAVVASAAANAAEGGTYDAATLPLEPAVLRSLCTTGCMPTLAALSYLLNKTQEEAQIQHLLMSYQSFTNTCGVLELTKPRDMFLVNLCGFALPNNGLPRDDPPSELIKNLFGSGNLSNVLANQHSRNEFISNLSKILLSPKNIQSLKALFNISHCLSEYLGNSSWLTVLETFQTLDTMIQISTELSYRLSRDQNFSEMYQSLLPHQTEINIMAAALSRLFESTRYLDDAAVTHVLSALGTLSLSSLANAATSENGDRSSNLSHTLTPPTSAAMNPTLPNNISSLNLPLNPPQTIRMFALMNLIATLEHNMFRITSARLWEIGIGHLTCVINHKDSQIRQYGVAALTKITILALSKPTTYQQQPNSANTNASQAQAQQQLQANGGAGSSQAIRTSKSLAALSNLSPAEFHSAIQVSLLEPFSDLFRSKYEDTRENILLSVFQILQSAGQFLVKGGWKIVLGILQAVVSPNVNQPAGGAAPPSASSSPDEAVDQSASAKLAAAIPSSPSSSASFIHVGFNSVQLITNDYLESIPFSSLGALIHTITAYCAQTSDTNISFTSIGLLWRVSDYLLRKQNRANSLSNAVAVPGRTNSPKPDPEIVPQPSSEQQNSGGDDAFLTDELSDELMHVVFTSLVSLAVDVRTEVRNSAVKTLHNTLVAHSSRMAVETCLSNLGSIVLPLLTRLLTDASLETNSNNASSSSTELGKDKSGKSVMMLIHYSRDTASKQWDETRVYALQGTARVLKGFTENLLRAAAGSEPTWMEAFQQHWLQFLQLNLVALSNPSPEVTLSALNSVLDLVLLLFAGGSGSASSTASANAGLPPQPSSLQPSAGAPTSSYLTPQLTTLLWTPILERFYVRGVLHAVVQHHHIEWCEDRERLYEKEKKDRKTSPSNFTTPLQPVSYISSPFKTNYADLNSEEGWKNWLKTYTHLIANFHTLAVHARRIFELHAINASRDDLIVILTLSNVLVGIHSLYNDRKLLSLLATRKLSAAASGTEVVVPDRKESPIQGAHLKLLETLTARTEPPAGAPAAAAATAAPAPPLLLSDGLWTTMIAQLCSLLSLEHASADIEAIEARVQHALSGAIPTIGGAANGGDSEVVSVPSFPSTSFAKRCLRVLDRCYSAAPATVRAQHFAQILSALQEAIRASSTALQRNGMAEVAEEAVASFIHVLETGLQSMNEQMESLLTLQQADPSRIEKEKSDNAAVWATIVDIFSSFLSPPGGGSILPSGEIDANPVYLPVNSSLNPAQQRLWENLQIALIGCLLRIVLPQIKHAQPSPTDIAKQVIRFFNISYRMQDGSDQANNPPPAAAEDGSISIATVNNELLSHSCLMALFHLVKLGGSNADGAFSNHMLVSSLAAPLLLQRCERILNHYLYLERIHSPNQPIARCHREEVGFMLGELARLSIHPAVSQACFRNKQVPALQQGQKGHLLALFPILCQCITMRESELRELLRDVFEQASIELGLSSAASQQPLQQ